MGERPAGDVKAVKTRLSRPYPDVPVIGRQQRANPVGSQRPRIRGIVPVGADTVGVRIPARDTTAVGRNPQRPISGEIQVAHKIAAQ